MASSRRRHRRRTSTATSRPHGSTPRWAYIGLILVAAGAVALVAAALLTT